MSDHRTKLLLYIVAESIRNVSEQYPNGYMHITKEQQSGVQELQAAGHVTGYPQSMTPQNTFPVVPTGEGVQFARTAQMQEQPAPGFNPQPAPQPAAAQSSGPAPFTVTISKGIPIPAARQRGFQSSGGSLVDRLNFDKMEVGDSFHVPPSGDPEKPVHRTFSSTVSQANAKLFPKKFTVREAIAGSDPEGPGARVWRDNDVVGEKPARKPRKSKNDTGSAQHQGGFPAPGAAPGGDFPSSGGFPAPGGFAPPGAAPQAQPGTFDPAAGGFAPPPGGFGGGFGGGGGFGQG